MSLLDTHNDRRFEQYAILLSENQRLQVQIRDMMVKVKQLEADNLAMHREFDRLRSIATNDAALIERFLLEIERIFPMSTKTVGKVKLKTDAKGKTKLERVHTYDASKSRKIAKSRKRRVVAPPRAK